MNAPITVLMPVFNGERYIKRALESLAVQTYKDFEIIAVDDGSTDRSADILHSFASHDRRLTVIRQANGGIVSALNRGLEAVSSPLIARMDADDWCDPERLEKQVAYLMDHPEIVACGCDVYFTDPEGRPLVRHHPRTEHEEILRQLLDGNGGAIIHPTLMVRREAMERIGGYRERYQWIEDLDLYLRLAEVGRLGNLNEPLLYYRQHLKSVNRTRGDRDALRREIVDPVRKTHVMDPLPVSRPSPAKPRSRSDWRRHWAYDAAKGGNWHAASCNSSRALILNPLLIQNWRCWWYVRKDKLYKDQG